MGRMDGHGGWLNTTYHPPPHPLAENSKCAVHNTTQTATNNALFHFFHTAFSLLLFSFLQTLPLPPHHPILPIVRINTNNTKPHNTTNPCVPSSLANYLVLAPTHHPGTTAFRPPLIQIPNHSPRISQFLALLPSPPPSSSLTHRRLDTTRHVHSACFECKESAGAIQGQWWHQSHCIQRCKHLHIRQRNLKCQDRRPIRCISIPPFPPGLPPSVHKQWQSAQVQKPAKKESDCQGLC